ncbi:hypothetical protein J6590_014828 [Homalodisca vitripennis]|nr:hypothetical protein J6590_014828 [Homalodisca vitripennis]
MDIYDQCDAPGPGRKAAGEEQFSCDKCGRSYNRKDNLYRHRRFECGVEPCFPCVLCPYKGRYKGHLQRHMVSRHLAELPANIGCDVIRSHVTAPVTDLKNFVV